MHVLSFVLPKYVLDGTVYKFLKIEQKAENLHVALNNAERNYLNTKNHATRLFSMLKCVERNLRVKKRCPELQDKGEKKKKIYKTNTNISCELCDKVFVHKGALTMHKKSHLIK